MISSNICIRITQARSINIIKAKESKKIYFVTKVLDSMYLRVTIDIEGPLS
jgi:hypothetical protein